MPAKERFSRWKKLLALLLFIVILWAAYFIYCLSKQRKDILLFCSYTAYACGDCYPRYRIMQVKHSKAAARNLVGREIDIAFRSPYLEKRFDKAVGIGAICYTYQLKGDLTYSAIDGYYTLLVTSYKLVSICDE